jgi:cytidylate kinase
MNYYVIAIDGPAGSGKSTIAKFIAKELNIHYIDSGALYRAATYHFLELHKNQNTPLEFSKWILSIVESNQVTDFLSSLDVKIEFGQGDSNRILIHNQDRSREIRTPEVTAMIRYLANQRVFRDWTNQRLRTLSQKNSLILDGRDIGTEVFPQAKYKFFLTADLDERTKRRWKELQDSGDTRSFEQVREEVHSRDESDRNRDIAPLIQAVDANLVDTTGLSLDSVIERILSVIRADKSQVSFGQN